MSNRTEIYKYLYLQDGDKWYPGFDYENMLTAENQLQSMYRFIGPGVINGWDVEKLTSNRADQIQLLDAYISDPNSELGQRLTLLDLDFTIICQAASTSNLTLSGLQTVDSIDLEDGNLILVKNQSTATQNGVYIVRSGSWVRSSVLSSSSDYNSNFLVYVESGTANTKTLWIGATSATAFTLNTTNLYFDDVFKQCVKVTAGNGIVKTYSAKTLKTNYFRYTANSSFYVWAEPSLCLVDDGICAITSPNPPNEDYDAESDAVYLATVETTPDPVYSDFVIVSEIVYEDRRNELTNLEGAFQEALRKAFYKHKHLGTVGNPSQINLSTTLILDCSNNDGVNTYPSSTIFIIKNQDGTNFTGSFSDYGLPEVTLDNEILDPSNYRIDTTSTPRKIYLKNSIEPNSLLQIKLPISPQKSLLFINADGELLSGNIAVSANIYLSDGTTITTTLSDGTTVTRYKRFSWSTTKYLDPIIKINGSLVNSKYYFVSSQGYFYFRSNYYSVTTKNYNDLSFVIEQVGREIQNKLPGSKLRDINAASFVKGKLDQKKIRNLDHIGDFRYKEPLSFIPSKKLISQGNRTTFYPQSSSELQFDTTCYYINNSLNFSNILIGSKRGLYKGVSPVQSLSWNVDKGRPKYIQDNILYPESENYFKTTYLLTHEGTVYFSSNAGKNWSLLKSPINSLGASLNINSFFVSTNKIENTVNSIISYGYSYHIYAATNEGLFIAEIQDGQSTNEWAWTKIKNIFNFDNAYIASISNLNNVIEISTKNVEIIENEPDKITYDRFMYVGASALYYGSTKSKNLKLIFNDAVKGMYWIDNGVDNFNKNNLIWFTDYEAFITRSAIFTEDANGSSWSFPLTFDMTNKFSQNAHAATISNLSATYNNGAGTLTNNSSQAPLVIDGITLSVGNFVLVKNQTSKIQNGLYTVTNAGSVSTNWILTRTSPITYSNYKIQNVSAGTINADSIWYVKPKSSFVLGTTEIEYEIYKFKIYSTTTPPYTATRPKIRCVEQRLASSLTVDNTTTYQYIIGHTDGLAVVTDNYSYPTSRELFWEAEYQGAINSIYSVSNNSNGVLYAATDRGIYASTEFLWTNLDIPTETNFKRYPWVRLSTEFYDTDEIAVFDMNLNRITDFNALYGYQAIEFATDRNIGSEYYYDRYYTDFYTDPWTDTNANIVVYINDKPSTIPYTTDPSIGLVRFNSSLRLKDINNVSITIVRFEAFISDIGLNPHAESYNNLVKSTSPIAYLTKSNAPASTTLLLNQKIDPSLKTLILDNGVNAERVTISRINNSKLPAEITLAYSRGSVGSTITFEPKTTQNTGTSVYAVKDSWSLGIEDKITKIESQHTYHHSSVNNANHILLDLSLQKESPTLFDISPAAPSGSIDKRGLKNLILTQDVVSGGVFDNFNSSSAAYVGLVPSVIDRATNPSAVFAILNPNKTGSNTRIATDKGIWLYNGTRWTQESSLDNATKTYYLKSTSDVSYIAGSDSGLYRKTSSWVSDPLFPQIQYDYISGNWGSGIFEAYGKSDGLSFVYKASPTSTFTSDSFNLVDEHNVYGLYKDKFLRLVDDGSGGVKQTEIDSLYLLSDVGIFGVADGANSNTLNSILVGRNMMATTKPSDVNYFYKAFRALPTPPSTKTPVPLFILTDKGILKIRNWRWCDPTDSAGNDFNIESRYLNDKACYCFALRQESSTPGKSKIFIGTDSGVYRSFDEGNNFEACERIEGGPVVVYDLAIFTSTYSSFASDVILACTERGMFYSIDDGDTWYRCGSLTAEGYDPVLFSFNAKTSVKFSETITTGGYIAQTFLTNSSATRITKAAVYLEKLDLSSNALYDYSCNNNVLSAYLYTIDEFGVPEYLEATSTTTVNPSEIEYPRFVNFEFNYNLAATNIPLAIVVLESVAVDGVSVMAWSKSNLNNPY